MALMLCDHLWGTVVPGNDWLTCLGRLAFPIFAFLLVEGYFHTKSLKKYIRRLLIFALLSEIPFNLAMGARLLYPLHQNVLWSFLISLALIHWNERAKAKGGLLRRSLSAAATVVLAYVLGLLSMVDYYHAGILLTLVFYFFRGRSWRCFLAQLLCSAYIHREVLGGYLYEFALGAHTFSFARQSFALLALIPIWLYRGRQGTNSKAFRWVCYAFYPLHLLLLGLIRILA